MKSKILKLLDEIQILKQEDTKDVKVSENAYYLNEDDILCVSSDVCDARYPYEMDGMNLWVHANGHIDINEGVLTIIKPVYFNEAACVGFWGGLELNEGEWFPVSITDTNKQLYEPFGVKRYTVFSKRCAYFIADTDKVVFATRMNITKDKKICVTSIAINKTKESVNLYLCTFFDFMIANTEFRNNWSSMGLFGKLYEDGTYRIYTNENNAIINKRIVSKNTPIIESTISKNTFAGGLSNSISNARALKDGYFKRKTKSANTTDIPVVCDIVRMSVDPEDSVYTAHLITVTSDFDEVKLIGNEVCLDTIKADIIKQEYVEKDRLSSLDICFDDIKIPTINKSVFNKFLKNVQKQVDFCAMGKNYAGALIGIRDVFQQLDTSVLWDEKSTKEKIVRALNYIFSNGRSPRQFSINHTDAEMPIMDIREFIDQGLWIINTVYNYISTTGDYAILDDTCSYYDMVDEDACLWEKGEETTVFEHLVRIMGYLISNIDKDTVCLKINFGDWNDAMNGLGKTRDSSKRFGNGVSVMATLQLYRNLFQMSELCKKRALVKESDYYREYMEKTQKGLLKHAIINNGDIKHIVHGWGDNQSYKVCTPNDFDGECRYSATAFSFWAICGMLKNDISVKDSILKAYEILDSEYGIKTLYPHFKKGAFDYVGNIANITKGTYENSCTYVHSVTFAIMALFIVGESKKAWEQIEKIIPITHKYLSKTPFVMPNSYCCNEEFEIDGESMGDWYTGGGCVLLRDIIKYAFGIQPDLDGVKIITAEYMPTGRASVSLNIKGCRFELTYKNENNGLRAYYVNGTKREGILDDISGCMHIYLRNEEFNAPVKVEVID